MRKWVHYTSKYGILLADQIKTATEYNRKIMLKNFLLSSPGKLWQHLSPKKKVTPRLCIGDTFLTDSAEIADALNKYFCQVFTRDNGIGPQFCNYEHMPICDVGISEEGVSALLLNLDTKKFPGADGIPNAILSWYAEWCSKYLTLIFDTPSSTKLPVDWK